MLVGEHYPRPIGETLWAFLIMPTMPTKIAVMLDGGHVRVHAKNAGKNYDPDYIEKIGLACSVTGESIHRIMYYDCPPYAPQSLVRLPG
jgi:hypothetical protein